MEEMTAQKERRWQSVPNGKYPTLPLPFIRGSKSKRYDVNIQEEGKTDATIKRGVEWAVKKRETLTFPLFCRAFLWQQRTGKPNLIKVDSLPFFKYCTHVSGILQNSQRSRSRYSIKSCAKKEKRAVFLFFCPHNRFVLSQTEAPKKGKARSGKRKEEKKYPTSASALHSCGGGGGREMEKKKKKKFFSFTPFLGKGGVRPTLRPVFSPLLRPPRQKDTSRVLLLEEAVEEEVGIGSLQDFLFASSSSPKFCHGNFPSLFPSVFSCGAKCESCHEGKRKKRRHLFSLFAVFSFFLQRRETFLFMKKEATTSLPPFFPDGKKKLKRKGKDSLVRLFSEKRPPGEYPTCFFFAQRLGGNIKHFPLYTLQLI